MGGGGGSDGFDVPARELVERLSAAGIEDLHQAWGWGVSRARPGGGPKGKRWGGVGGCGRKEIVVGVTARVTSRDHATVGRKGHAHGVLRRGGRESAAQTPAGMTGSSHVGMTSRVGVKSTLPSLLCISWPTLASCSS